MSDAPAKPTRFLSSPEILVVNLIVSTTIALPLPIVSFERERWGQPLPLHFLWQDFPWRFVMSVPVVTATTLLGLLSISRSLFPSFTHSRFRWALPTRRTETDPQSVPSARPAVYSLLIAFLAVSLLTVVSSHFYIDRTTRVPVMSWKGPMLSGVREAAVAGYVFAGLATLLATYALVRSRRLMNILAVFSLMFVFCILLMTWACSFKRF